MLTSASTYHKMCRFSTDKFLNFLEINGLEFQKYYFLVKILALLKPLL